MNEININIIHSPSRSSFRRIIGILNILLCVSWIIVRKVLKEPVSGNGIVTFLDIVYPVIFGLSGVVYLIEGYGISLNSWFGEAYIRIDMTSLCVKKGVLSKEWVLLWNEVDQVEFSVIRIKFRLKNNSSVELNYDNLEYEHIQDIKKSIKAIAGEKNIKVLLPL